MIEDGEIREMGSHEELIQLDGVYKKLVISQLMNALESLLDLVDAGTQATLKMSSYQRK